MYSLLETNQDIDQFLKSIYRYVQLGIYIRGYQDKVTKHFHREIGEVVEFYVTENNEAKTNTIFRKTTNGKVTRNHPSSYLIDYLDGQGVTLDKNIIMSDEEVLKKQQVNQALNNDINNQIRMEQLMRSQQNNNITPNYNGTQNISNINSNNVGGMNIYTNYNKPEVLFENGSNNTGM